MSSIASLRSESFPKVVVSLRWQFWHDISHTPSITRMVFLYHFWKKDPIATSFDAKSYESMIFNKNPFFNQRLIVVPWIMRWNEFLQIPNPETCSFMMDGINYAGRTTDNSTGVEITTPPTSSGSSITREMIWICIMIPVVEMLLQGKHYLQKC